MAIDCIGIDIGYGFTKTCGSDKTQMFPTAVAQMTRESTFTEMSPIVVNGQRYLVGEEAEREGNTFDACQSGFVASGPWLAVLAQCLKINNFVRGEIVMGVPPGLYSSKYCQGILEAIRASDMRINGKTYRVSGNVRIIPRARAYTSAMSRATRRTTRRTWR